jgi:phosphoribosyl-AMP cyclohydrolase
MNEFAPLKYDERGLIPAVVQDFRTGEVLMVAYMNEESLGKTLKTGKVHFWSRSREKLWLKGESSGNVQLLREIRTDCDRDTLLLKVEQIGDAACHTGYRSCFFNMLPFGEHKEGVVGEKIFDPEKVYGKK